jgi:hypothetical protein
VLECIVVSYGSLTIILLLELRMGEAYNMLDSIIDRWMMDGRTADTSAATPDAGTLPGVDLLRIHLDAEGLARD